MGLRKASSLLRAPLRASTSRRNTYHEAYDLKRKVWGSSDYEQLRTNWAENVQFGQTHVHRPQDIVELQAAVTESSGSVRVVGSGHSFNPICASPNGGLIAMNMMSVIDEIDAEAMTVTMQGGTTYGQLCRFLAKRGCGLAMTASLPHVSVAGAVATGTHGSGLQHRNLASQVESIEFVAADGSLNSYSRQQDGADFSNRMIHMGCLGVVSKIELQIVPEFNVFQSVYTKVPFEALLAGLDQLVNTYDSISVFHNFGSGMTDALWLKQFGDQSSDPPILKLDTHPLVGGELVTEPVPFLESGAMVNTTQFGPWWDVMHFFLDSKCRDVQMPNMAIHTEFFVSLDQATEALRAVDQVASKWSGWGQWDEETLDASTAGQVVMSELRIIRGDDLLLSPHNRNNCGGGDSLAIHFTFGQYPEAVNGMVAELEAALRPFQARPHWGKVFHSTADQLGELYGDMIPQFQEICHHHDPTGKFQNAWSRHLLMKE